MYFMWVIGLLGIVMMYVVSSATSDNSEVDRDFSADSSQMIVYHQAAELFCDENPAICVGSVQLSSANIKTKMPSSITSGPNYDGQRFISFFDNNMVITIHGELNGILSSSTNLVSTNKFVIASKKVSVFLQSASRNRYVTGSFGVGEITGPTGLSIVVPTVISGITISENVPMVVSP
jgi:hypothetical protein